MERVTISIDGDLLHAVDSLVREQGYPNRSEAVRALLREAAAGRHAAASQAPCVATLTYIFDHNVRDLSRRLTTHQHDHHELSIASTQIRFSHDSCLEVAILEGTNDAIRRFANTLTAQRGVRHPYLHLIPVRKSAASHSHEPGAPSHSHTTV